MVGEAMRGWIALASILGALFVIASSARAEDPKLEINELRLAVATVSDPDFPPLEPEVAKHALDLASIEFAKRFNVSRPTFELENEFTISGFLGEYALPVDPRCKPSYDARYRGGGRSELDRYKSQAIKFLQKWPLESLLGFIDESERIKIKTYDDVYEQYARRYVRTVDAMKGLKTPSGSPLVEPGRSARRSSVAWLCAFLRQTDYDVVLTNTFILADLLTEPQPHAVFGKAKIGGIATRSPARTALDGQALLATTFGIDTTLKEFAELPADPPDSTESAASLEKKQSERQGERAKILGVYLLAHEIGHAVFGIPDNFDHPKGCLMASRPAFTYRDGLKELEANPAPCPRCRPYVEARAAYDRATRLFKEERYAPAAAAAMTAANLLPQQFHGGRKHRMAQIIVLASKSYRALGKEDRVRSLVRIAHDLDPTSEEVAELWRASGIDAGSTRAIAPARTASTASAARARHP